MGKYKKNDIVEGLVTGIEDYGIFVGLDEYYSGLIHISEISDGYVKNIGDFVNIGDTIKAKVIESSDDNYHVKLSIKDLKYHLEKKSRKKIIETGSGFKILSDNLNKWINEYEYNKNNK